MKEQSEDARVSGNVVAGGPERVDDAFDPRAPWSSSRSPQRWPAIEQEPSGDWRKYSARGLATLMVFALCCGAFIQWRRTSVIFDDAFISYRYAHNLVHGAGLVFNRGERVEGYSNFLWVLIASVAIWVRRDPLTLARVLGVGSYLGAVLWTGWLAARPEKAWDVRRLPGVVLVTLLVLPTDFAAFAGTGLETSFIAFLLLAMGMVHHLTPRTTRWWLPCAATLPLLAILTRLDAALAIFASGAAYFAAAEPSNARATGRLLLRVFGASALGLAGYLAWKGWYYGALLPNTYYAKGAGSFHPEAGVAYVLSFVKSCPVIALVVPVLGFGVGLAPRGPRASFILYCLLVIALTFAYALKVGGDFMEYRFVWEAWPVAVCGCVVAIDELARKALIPSVVLSLLMLVVTPVPVVLENRFGMQSIARMDKYARLGMRVGGAIERAVPAGTTVATTLAGMAYFFPGLTTIDQWGLNDKYVAHLKVEHLIEVPGLNARGHVKYAPESYLRDRGVNLVIGHPTVCDCNTLCREDKPDVYIRLGERNECLRTWYMTPRPELTRAFCSHPETFVLDHVSCPAPVP